MRIRLILPLLLLLGLASCTATETVSDVRVEPEVRYYMIADT